MSDLWLKQKAKFVNGAFAKIGINPIFKILKIEIYVAIWMLNNVTRFHVSTINFTVETMEILDDFSWKHNASRNLYD